MKRRLSFEDRRTIADLLEQDERRRPMELLLARIALAAGTGIIVAAAALTLRDLRDATVLTILVPGVLAGLFLIVLSRVVQARARDLHRMAELIRNSGLDP